MTQKLILIGFLGTSVALMGMEPEEYTISKSDINRGLEALKVAVERKQKLSEKQHDFFLVFNTNAKQYFAPNVFVYDKEDLLASIHKTLPKMITYTEKDKTKKAYEAIDIFLNNEDINYIAEDDNMATNLFGSIYFMYLEKHPKDLHLTLSDYFRDEMLIKNQHCRKYIGTMLGILTRYVNKRLAYYPDKKNFNYEQLSTDISEISNYLKNFETQKKLSFNDAKKYIDNIYDQLDGAELVSTSIPMAQEETPSLELAKTSQEQVTSETQSPETVSFTPREVVHLGEADMSEFLKKQQTSSSWIKDKFWAADNKIQEMFKQAMESIRNLWKRLSNK